MNLTNEPLISDTDMLKTITEAKKQRDRSHAGILNLEPRGDDSEKTKQEWEAQEKLEKAEDVLHRLRKAFREMKEDLYWQEHETHSAVPWLPRAIPVTPKRPPKARRNFGRIKTT